MRTVGPVGWSFFPLDEELGLLPQRCTPRLVAQIARLGTACTSFREAQALLRDLLGVELTSDTVRRITLSAGREALGLDQAQARALRETLARPPAARVVDRLQQVSVDGAMVPLVGGTWEEVKCVVIGRVEATAQGPRARELTYFARLADADQFIAEAGGEFSARGTEQAREVVAVNDGAEWIQRFLDEHCPAALRIIDWTHAANYVRACGPALFGPGTANSATWSKRQLELLWEGKVESVVKELTNREDDSDRLKPVREARHYLEKRVEMLRYAAFREGGYPIGSGIVESANKLVVEARLKGAGKHWAPTNVNPMLSLRCANASNRWQRRWREVERALRRRHRHRPLPPPAPPPAPAPASHAPVPGASYVATFRDGKPTPAHPWSRRRVSAKM